MTENLTPQEIVRKRQEAEDLKGRCALIAAGGGLFFIPKFIALVAFSPWESFSL
ncbi:MAG: hypothetical protein QXN93_05530 [Methanomassiliicoccales archaeon]